MQNILEMEKSVQWNPGFPESWQISSSLQTLEKQTRMIDADAFIFCELQKTQHFIIRAKQTFCLHTFIILISFECLNKHLLLPAWQFLLFMSALQHSQSNNNSEQSFGHMAMFTHKFLLLWNLCAELYLSHTQKQRLYKMTKVVQTLCNTSFPLVVYIYYKCTIWLQFKRLLRINPFGNNTVTKRNKSKRHNCETI